MSPRVCASEWAILLLAYLLSQTGCGPRAGAAVSGQITLDGSPLDDATITFVPMSGGQRQAAWASISVGHFEIAPSAGLGTGQFRIEIRALRAVAGKSNQNDPTLIPAKEAVPSRYNSNSELVVDIKRGTNEANFELKSK